jgi:hypothetical protein
MRGFMRSPWEELVPVREIRVWDPFIRICHWLLAVAVIWDWFSEDPLWLHTWQGKRMIEFYSPTGPAFGRHSSNERGSLRLVRSHPT